jgi:type III secretory pathway component EscU
VDKNLPKLYFDSCCFIERVFGYAKFPQLGMVAYVAWKTSELSVSEGLAWLMVGCVAMVVIGFLDWKYVYRDESLASAKHSIDELIRKVKE